MGEWAYKAASAINRVHAQLPPQTSLPDRIKAVDAAYPFGERTHFPYKAWLKERRLYLSKYGYQPQSKAIHESPLERMIRRNAQ